jgi:histidyl-tRNA synthetase
MNSKYQAPSGIRDYYPSDYKIRQWLFDKWTSTCDRFGFSMYDSAILEKTNLYSKKGGDDIIKEMYSFTDAEGTELCLRPEMTPSLVRMSSAIINCTTLPIRWSSIAQCFRFETVTANRKREHYQWNCDIVGGNNVSSIVELLTMTIHFFQSVGLSSNDIAIHISDRQLFQQLFIDVGINIEQHNVIFNIIDKIKKKPKEELESMMYSELGLTREQIDAIFSLAAIETIEQLGKIICSTTITKEITSVFDVISAAELGDWIVFDPTIVRGLSYYTGIVFEIVSKNTDIQRSICGGGIYNKLFETYGHKAVNVAGFGLGDVVILDILKKLNKIPNNIASTNAIDYCIICYSHDLYVESMKYSIRLRNKRFNVTYYTSYNIGRGLKYATKIGAHFAILFCPKEFADGAVRIKDLTKATTIDNNDPGDLHPLATLC